MPFKSNLAKFWLRNSIWTLRLAAFCYRIKRNRQIEYQLELILRLNVIDEKIATNVLKIAVQLQILYNFTMIFFVKEKFAEIFGTKH